MLNETRPVIAPPFETTENLKSYESMTNEDENQDKVKSSLNKTFLASHLLKKTFNEDSKSYFPGRVDDRLPGHIFIRTFANFPTFRPNKRSSRLHKN